MTRFPKPTHVYVGTAPCGCVQALSSYHWDWRNGTAEQVAEMITCGLVVRCLTWDEYQVDPPKLENCPHGEIVDGETMQPALMEVGAGL